MALHSSLPIYKAAYDLLGISTDLVRNLPRDIKSSLGGKIRDECIEAYLPWLGASLNPKKTILQPVARGVDFVGHVIKPWRRTMRRRTVRDAIRRVAEIPGADLRNTANAYFGLLRQASHSHADRAKLARAILRRGRAVNGSLTKTYHIKG